MKTIAITILLILNSIFIFAQKDEYLKKCYELLGKKEFSEAINYAQKALYLDNEDLSVLNTLAWCQLQNKNFNEALQTLLKAQAILPTKPNDNTLPFILSNLGHSYLLTNNYQKAMQVYNENSKYELNGKKWFNVILEDLVLLN